MSSEQSNSCTESAVTGTVAYSKNTVVDLDLLEKEIYKSSLKQIVSFLNTTLPPVIKDSEESDEKPKEKIKIKKNKTEEKIDLRDSYLIKSVTPKRELKNFKKKEEPEGLRKRFNTFSERKLNDLKVNKKLHKTKKN